MKRKLLLSILIASLVSGIVIAQLPGKINLGVGAGLDFGGIGARISILPVSRVGIFGALGYNLNSLGYNIGAQIRFPSEKRINAYLTGMYGYNAVLIVKGMMESKTTYYGPSIGIGLIYKSAGGPSRTYMSFELLLPFRPECYHNDIDDLKNMGFEVKEPWPVAFSIGYHIRL